MAIGTIDCTIHKSLCNEYDVSGYPTLKFSIDGVVADYPSGRSENDFVQFSEKMLLPPVVSVNSVSAATQYAKTSTEQGLVFLAYHPAVVADETSSIDDQLKTTEWTQIYAQVARKLRASGHFLLLDTSGTPNDETAAAVAAEVGQTGEFVCRIEDNVPPRCYTGTTNPDEMFRWVERENMPTVVVLGAHNFHKLGRKGRPLVIAAVDVKSDDTARVKQEMARYAISGPAHIRDKYFYGLFDGVTWKRFLEQFEVTEVPQIFILDVATKKYWQNATYKLNVDDFLQAVEDGIVPSKSAVSLSEETLMKINNFLSNHRQLSAILAVLFFVSFGVAVCSCITPGDDLRPPYPKKTTGKTPAEESKRSEKETAEPKKEK
jgi:hypothetical protein